MTTFRSLLLLALASAVAAGLVGPAVPASTATVAQACPRAALGFGANPVAPATRAALAQEKPRTRPQVTEAVVATGDLRGRGGEVKHQCGTQAARRTVVVYITLRAFLPSASLSERVSFVSRFKTGWRVWEIAH